MCFGNKGECFLWIQKIDRYYKIFGIIDLIMCNMVRLGDNFNVYVWFRYIIECEVFIMWECVFCNIIGMVLIVNVFVVGVVVLIGCFYCGN